jgi:hypothetical protein
MTSIVLHSTSGPDGKLHLEVPVGQPGTEFEVEVTARPKSARIALPPGYFNLIGSIVLAARIVVQGDEDAETSRPPHVAG